MTERFYVTTSIFYANGPLHIGHCYESVAADVLARYHRARGAQVRLLTGTDEHGIRIQRQAESLGISPQAYVDQVAAADRALSDRLQISYDDFIRTSEARHRQAVQQIFTRLYDQGDIYKTQYEGWYCQHEESFWPAGRVLEGHLCPECGRPLEWSQEEAYNFRLSRYAPQLLALLERPDFLVPPARRNEIRTFARQGLTDIAVSRTSVTWGIPVPFDPAHTIYVWVDALSNYITALGYGSADERLYRQFWPAAVHLVGKDIARFHAVIWPALLLALGEPLPARVWGHGWFNVDGVKISKSLGNSIDPHLLIDRYGLDPVRYYLLRELPFGPDYNHSEAALLQRYNQDLANDLGNLLSRTTSMLNKWGRGRVPAPQESDGLLQSAAAEAVDAAEASLEQLRLSDALGHLLRLVGRANKYIEERSPWGLVKDPARRPQLDGVLYDLAECLRLTAGALTPFLVETPERIYGQLGLEPAAVRRAPWAALTRWGGLEPGTLIARAEPLFPRVEAPDAVK